MPQTCSICHNRSVTKLAAAYWAWYPEPDKRIARKVLYCRGDADILAGAIAMGYDNDWNPKSADSEGCCNCGTAITDGVWLVTYATVYVPNQEQIDLELWSCEACAVQLRAHVVDHGDLLPNREQTRLPSRARENPWGSLIPTRD